MKKNILYKDNRCICYVAKELMFEINIDGKNLKYILSGHPYTPTFIATCEDKEFSYSEQGGLWFPDSYENDWSKFCQELSRKLEQNYKEKKSTI